MLFRSTDIGFEVFDFVKSKIKDINATDRYGITALHMAATFSTSMTQMLLKAGADPTLATYEGLTALHLAARSMQGNTVGLLLDVTKGNVGYVNAVDRRKWTPLCYACCSGRPETVKMLLDVQASVDGEIVGEAISQFGEEQLLWIRESVASSEQGSAGGAKSHRQHTPFDSPETHKILTTFISPISD